MNNRDINIDQNNRDNHFGNNRAALIQHCRTLDVGQYESFDKIL